ncbi:MAG: hypothetical protein K2O15_00185 [Lachnospiraceae bacterium]|nr:hypothetical protein [Lachnospiraceae bacterium]
MEDTREKGQNQENKRTADGETVFPFIEKLPIDKDWEQIEEEAEEVYQGI